MYFYEVLASGNRDIIIEEFLKLFGEKEEVDVDATKTRLISAIDTMSKIKPNLSEDFTIHIAKVKNEWDYSAYDDVWAWDKNKSPKYAFECDKWVNILGYLVDGESLEKYGVDKFSALVLWEMTYFGYDEETIKKHIESWGNNNE